MSSSCSFQENDGCKKKRAAKINVKEKQQKKIQCMTVRCFVVGCLLGCDGTRRVFVSEKAYLPWRENMTAGAATVIIACCVFF